MSSALAPDDKDLAGESREDPLASTDERGVPCENGLDPAVEHILSNLSCTWERLRLRFRRKNLSDTYVVGELADSQETAGGQLRLRTVAIVGDGSERRQIGTYVFNSSGKGSSSCGQGNRTKLTLLTGTAGILFVKRYSSNHMGIVSSNTGTSIQVLATVPL